jgi:hypothetical protein
MRIGAQRHECNGGNDREKDLRAQPDDEREIKKSAKESLHPESILFGPGISWSSPQKTAPAR